jgi:hypothetical protein
VETLRCVAWVVKVVILTGSASQRGELALIQIMEVEEWLEIELMVGYSRQNSTLLENRRQKDDEVLLPGGVSQYINPFAVTSLPVEL